MLYTPFKLTVFTTTLHRISTTDKPAGHAWHVTPPPTQLMTCSFGFAVPRLSVD